MFAWITRLTHGRYLQRGLTWTSAAAAVVLVVLLIALLGFLADRNQPQYPMTVEVVSTGVMDDGSACTWQVDLEITNDADRPLRLISVATPEISGSEQGMLGSFEPGETISRTYMVAVPDCDVPAADRLVVRYGPAMSTKVRSIDVDLE